MSATINTIPASTIVNVIPSVISAGGSALDLLGLMLSTGPRVPIGAILAFPTIASVNSYFGATSPEAAHATVYFNGFLGANKLPASLLIAQYNLGSVGAFLRGGNVSAMTLAQLQALTGVITLTIDGTPHTSASIVLSGATSFSSAAQLMNTGLGLTGPTQASVTGSMGASSTGTGTGTSLVLTAVTGVIHPGTAASASISGTGVPANTYIVSQSTGTTGGNGTYITNNATTAAAATITVTSTTVDVTAVASGTLAVGQELTGTGLLTTTYIVALGTGTGGVGTYVTGIARQIVSEAMVAVLPVVSYDSQSGAFVIISSTTGAASTITFVTGTLSAALLLTAATGAVISQGVIAQVPATFMAAIIAQTQNWASFWLIADPDAGSGNVQKLLFAAWVNSTRNRYVYITGDSDILPTESTAATTSLGYILNLSGSSGTVPIYQATELYLPAFVSGFIASLDFTEHNGRATAAFKGQSGLGTSISDAVSAANLVANHYNYYGAFATANDNFRWIIPGSITGAYDWLDSYVNQIWLNNQLQLALMSLLDTVKSIPYNPSGYALIRAACLDPINAAVNFGAIRENVPLSAAQAAEVNNAAGLRIDSILTTQGWYLQILAATPQVRAARQSPPMSLWYMDGESVQQLTLASILIQ